MGLLKILVDECGKAENYYCSRNPILNRVDSWLALVDSSIAIKKVEKKEIR